MARGLIAALEEEQVIAEAVAEAVSEENPVLSDAAESPETAMLEVQEIAADGDVQNEQVENALEVSDALDELGEVVQIADQQGGLSTESLQILNISLKYCDRRVGIENKSISMESYSDPSQKLAAKVAMESIMDKAKQVGKAIVDAIKRALEWIAGFFKAFGSAVGRQRSRCAKLKELSAKSAIGGGTIDNSGLAHKLSSSGKIQLTSAAETVKKLVGDFVAKTYSVLVENTKIVTDAVVDGDKGKQAKYAEELFSNFLSFSKEHWEQSLPGELKIAINAEEIQKKISDHIGRQGVDAKTFFSKFDFGGVEGAKNVKDLAKFQMILSESFKIVPVETAKAAESLPSLNASDVKNSLETIDDILGSLLSFEKESGKIEKECRKLISGAEKALDGSFSINHGLRREWVNLASSIVTANNRISAQVARYGMNFCKAGMDYVELSLKAV